MDRFMDTLNEVCIDDSFELIGRINEELRSLNFLSLLTVYNLLFGWDDDFFCRWADKVVSKAFKEGSEGCSSAS